MKKIAILAMGLVISMTALGQDVETTIGSDIVSSYQQSIWFEMYA